jgi:hypothetical protein
MDERPRQRRRLDDHAPEDSYSRVARALSQVVTFLVFAETVNYATLVTHCPFEDQALQAITFTGLVAFTVLMAAMQSGKSFTIVQMAIQVREGASRF